MVNKNFYIEFGKIVYAMAMADGAIQKEEKDVLFKMVKEELSPIEHVADKYGSDLSYYTLFSFETEEEIMDSVDDAMNSFFTHIKLHNLNVSETVRTACINILKKVAASHGRTTIKEGDILGRFEKKLHAHA